MLRYIRLSLSPYYSPPNSSNVSKTITSSFFEPPPRRRHVVRSKFSSFLLRNLKKNRISHSKVGIYIICWYDPETSESTIRSRPKRSRSNLYQKIRRRMQTRDFDEDTMRRSQLGSDNDSSSSEKASSSSDQPHQSGSSTSSSVRVRASSTSSPQDDGGGEGVQVSARSTENTASNTKSAGKLRLQDLKSLFPWTLFMLLEYAEKTNQEYIFSWSPCGTSFKVHKRDDFIDKLLPEFGLLKMTKYKS